jgi:hypothetical protein
MPDQDSGGARADHVGPDECLPVPSVVARMTRMPPHR